MTEAASSVMLMVAPNGARRTKADHPALPLSPREIAAEAKAAMAAGAVAIHLHVRDAAGAHSLDAERYREALAALRAAVGDGMIAQITTEAAGRFTPREQMACVRALVPGAVSLALRELAPDDGKETLARAGAFFRRVAQAGVSAQFILYSPDDVRRFVRLREEGVVPFARPFLLMVLGRHAADGESAPEELDAYVEALGGAAAEWAVCAFGRREAEIALHAARLGGHARIGFENNLHLPDGSLAPDNAALVAATRALLEREGFRLMPVEEAREIFAAAARLAR